MPTIKVEAIEDYATKDNVSKYLEGNPDYVVDCIDNLDAKTALVEECLKRKIKIISSGGAGMRADPTRI